MPKHGRDLDKRDPKVADLRHYRREREKAARKAASPPKARGGGFLGSNPRAGLILALVAVVLLALFVLPRFL
jgi:hypothetical protein